MKRTTVVVLIVAVVVVVTGVLFRTAMKAGIERSMRREWPANLGSVAGLASQYPAHPQNDGATRLVALAAPLGIELAPGGKRQPDFVLSKTADYVRREQGKATREVTAPPAEVAQYLATHAAELDAVREHLLRAELAWPVDLSKRETAPLPNLLGHMQLTRVLVARALTNGSWDDLQAAWLLSKPLQSRPETVTQLIALAMSRTINAAAWKLPAPAPAWLAEMHSVDHVRQLARTMQAETWMASQYADTIPFGRFGASKLVNHQLDLTAKLVANQECGADMSRVFEEHLRGLGTLSKVFTPNLASAWRRAFRHRAEREGTTNALRIAAGEPVVSKSVCSDGTWRFDNGTLAFSRDLPKGEPHEVDMPLTLSVR